MTADETSWPATDRHTVIAGPRREEHSPVKPTAKIPKNPPRAAFGGIPFSEGSLFCAIPWQKTMEMAFSVWLKHATPIVPSTGNMRPLQLLWAAISIPESSATNRYI